VRPKPPVPVWRWALWWALLAPALVLFYVIFLPVWVGVRLARLFADAKSRQLKRSQSSTGGSDSDGA
jgi:hypothetical protein